jgi:hypothetical protein
LCLENALNGAPSGLTSAALGIIVKRDDPHWCPQIDALFRRVNPVGQIPEPHIWMTSLKFLLRHKHGTSELLAVLPRAAGYEIGEAVLLVLEHAPELALPLIRKGLLADVPIDRSQIARLGKPQGIPLRGQPAKSRRACLLRQ